MWSRAVTRMWMCGGRPSYDAGKGHSNRKRPSRRVKTVALPARGQTPLRFDCQNCTAARRSGAQLIVERTTPVSTWPRPIFARTGGIPRPNGPKPSGAVAAHARAVPADPPAAVANTATIAQTTNATSLTSAIVDPAVGARDRVPTAGHRSAPEDLVDGATGQGDHEEVSVGSGLDVGDDTEVAAREQALALRHLMLGEVVRDAVLEPRVVDGDVAPVPRQVEVEEIAVLQVRRRRSAHEEVALVLRAEPASGDEADPARCDLPLPAERRVDVVGARQHEEPRARLRGRIRDVRRRPAELLEVSAPERRLDLLELGDPLDRACDLHPAAVHPGGDAVELGERVVAVLLQPEAARERVDRDPEAVAVPVREQPLHVRAHLAADRRARREKRVVGRRRAVVVEPEDDAGAMRVVRRRPAELVVCHGRARARRRWSACEVLELPAAADVAGEHVQLPVGAECDDAAVVIAARGLTRILLNRADPDQVAVERQARAVPDVAVDAVPEQRRLAGHRRVGA